MTKVGGLFMKWLNLLAIKFMQNKSALLTGGTDSYIDNDTLNWISRLNTTLKQILVPILSVVAAAGAIYAVVIAVQMAKADSGEKREEAKKRLISVIVAVVVLAVLILFFLVLLPEILKAILKNQNDAYANWGDADWEKWGL